MLFVTVAFRVIEMSTVGIATPAGVGTSAGAQQQKIADQFGLTLGADDERGAGIRHAIE